MSPRIAAVVALTVVSAFSAFPSPFYSGVAAASALGLWAAAVMFSIHGVAVIVAMSALRAASWPVADRHRAIVTAALVVDAVGGLVLAWGMATESMTLLLTGRAITGLALGLATPVLTAVLARHRTGTAWATAATLGGVGIGAVAAAALESTGVSVPGVFISGAVVVAAVIAVVPFLTTRPATGASVTWEAPDGIVTRPQTRVSELTPALASALVITFVATGILGLFTSLIPAVTAPALGGGAGLAGVIVAVAMIGAGGARLVGLGGSTRGLVVTVTIAVAAVAVFAAGIAYGHAGTVVASATMIGAACGVGYDMGLRLAIGPQVDALRRVAVLARVQRAGQVGLVVPALAFPLLPVT